MTSSQHTQSVDSFADLKTLYAEMTATPQFQAAFGDPLAVSITQPGEEPGEHDMPEPFASMSILKRTLRMSSMPLSFSLCTDTRGTRG